jgi:hypothetical protein
MPSAGGDVGEGAGVRVGVVAHVEAEAVQPVRAHEGDERVDVGAAGLERAGGAHGVAHRAQVALERVGAGVGGRLVRRAAPRRARRRGAAWRRRARRWRWP